MGNSLRLELLLPLCSVVLIHLVFDLPHTFSLFDSEHLSLLIPAPLVDLTLGQASPSGDELKGLFGPVRVRLELCVETAELLAGFTLASADDTVKPTCLWVVEVTSTLVGDHLLLASARL